ncbi:MAG: carbohydrate ABC transporter permease [Rhodoferax sp.]|nr:carbohydrate ABC transporter permease [Rhodoferax sp.]MCB2042898.1 carbohydrate ABC transporter permease [Rhodoferax sp.]
MADIRHASRTERAIVLFVTALILFPVLWLLFLSFIPGQDIAGGFGTIGRRFTLENFTSLWDAVFANSFVNSLVVGVVSVVIAIALGAPFAFWLSRAHLSARSDFGIGLIILATRMAPPIAFTLPYFLAYRYAEIMDTRLGLILVYVTINLSLVVWTMRTFFDGVPTSIDESAEIDGASRVQTFFEVVLPMSATGLVATTILAFIYAWNDFFFALILTRTEAMTAPVAIVNFLNFEGWEWGKIAAGGVMVMAPVALFSLAMQKYLVKGLSAGAVKG